MLVRVRVLESLPPTPLVVVVAVVAPDPADQAVAAEQTMLYQVVNPVPGFTTFFSPSNPSDTLPTFFRYKPTVKNLTRLFSILIFLQTETTLD